jgi:hypothetical protein
MFSQEENNLPTAGWKSESHRLSLGASRHRSGRRALPQEAGETPSNRAYPGRAFSFRDANRSSGFGRVVYSIVLAWRAYRYPQIGT